MCSWDVAHGSPTIHWHNDSLIQRFTDTTIHWHNDSLTQRFTDTTIHWHNDSLTQRYTDTTIHWHNDSLTPRFTDNTKSVEIHIWGPAPNTKSVWIHIWSPAPNTENPGSEGYGINKIWGFCSNMDLSDHLHFAYRGFRGRGIQWKKSHLSETNGSQDNCIQKQWIPIDVMLKNFCFFSWSKLIQ